MNEHVFKIRNECYVGRVRGNRCENTKRKQYLNEIFYILKRLSSFRIEKIYVALK